MGAAADAVVAAIGCGIIVVVVVVVVGGGGGGGVVSDHHRGGRRGIGELRTGQRRGLTQG